MPKSTRTSKLVAAMVAASALGAGTMGTVGARTDGPTTEFRVTIENVSGGFADSADPAAGDLPTPLAPGVFTVSDNARQSLFWVGRHDDGEGLEALAEDGSPGDLGEAVADRIGAERSGVFAVPAGADGPGPVLPGDAYEFTVNAEAGDRLSFATMFVQSNDWFFAPNGWGIPLFDGNDHPRSGDVSREVVLVDAGTEIDQEPGSGDDQAPRQSGPDTGDDDPNRSVRRIRHDVTDHVRVTITPVGSDGAPGSGQAG